MTSERTSKPPIPWTQEDHGRWKAAASAEVSRLFQLLKRKEIEWTKPDSKILDELDQVILGRLKVLRDKEKCPEALTYFGWEMQKFYDARKAQATIGGHVDADVAVVYRRVMSSFEVSWCYRLAIRKQDPIMDWMPELDGRVGLRPDATYRDRATAYMGILKERHLA